MSIFRANKKKVDKGFKKMDRIVTGLFLGSIIASVYGIKKHENEKKNEFFNIRPKENKGKKMSVKEIFKGLVFGVEHIKDDKKPGFVKSMYLFISHILKNGGKK